jgi:Transposase DDE domain
MINYGAKLHQILAYWLGNVNLSRKKLITGFILGAIKSKSVKFADIAAELDLSNQTDSNLRRIQNFFANYALEYQSYARLLMSFVPLHSLSITIDRTNWQFGSTKINILCLTVGYRGVGIPILFDFLDKKGNSNTQERIDLMDQFTALFGTKCIQSLTADREFIGDKWYQYLIQHQIPFYLRIAKSHRLTLGGIHYRVDDLINAYPKNKKGEIHWKNIQVHGISKLHVGLKKLILENQTVDYLAILSNCPNNNPLQVYKKRWSIEVFFQSIKKRGFDFEQTHLTHSERLKKLFALVALAFALCVTIGIHQNDKVKTIEVKNHGYKQNSFFRTGLDQIKRALLLAPFDLILIQNVFLTIEKIISKIIFTKKFG